MPNAAQVENTAAPTFTVGSVDSMAAFDVGFGRESNQGKPIKAFIWSEPHTDIPKPDPNYFFQKNVTRDILMGQSFGGHVYTVGPTGSGKTTVFEQIAARTNRPFFRQQFHQEMEPDELLGTWTMVNGNMTFLHSGLVRALLLPSIIVFDEFDSGNPAVSAVAQALLEGKDLVIAKNAGQRITPHPDCLICGTGNTNGMGDESGLYASTTVQSFATMNRWGMFVPIDYMDSASETALMTKIYSENVIPGTEIAKMVKVAGQIRSVFTGGEINAVLSTRQLIMWGKWLSVSGSPTRSFNLAFGNQLGEIDFAAVSEILKKTFAGK